MRFPGSMAMLCTVSLAMQVVAGSDDKAKVIVGGAGVNRSPSAFQPDADPGGGGYRTEVTNGTVRVPVVVVGGTPYQRGWHFGRLMKDEIRQFVPAVVKGFQGELKVDEATLDRVWAATSGHTDDRVEQEILGVADGAGLPVRTLQHAHCLPLLMPYSCSSIAAWGSATSDGHLYQTRNLDWSLEAGAHEFPVLLVQLPVEGQAHVMPTFAGVIGAHCGMNSAGLVLSEIGDAGKAEAPYDIHAPHFTTWFRTLLYDARSLTEALEVFSRTPQTKRYHFVFGDGRQDRRAVKIRTDTRAQGADRIRIWADRESTDELAPDVLSCVVYHDEGRGAFPSLAKSRGKLDGPALVAIANTIPIKGGNVVNVVFDGTALRLWVSYAGGTLEAYQRPPVFLDLMALDGDGDGQPDIVEGARDRDGDGRLDFLPR